MIKFIKSFFTKRESKFEHPLDAVTTPKVEEVIAPVVETPVTETPQKKKRNYNKKTK